MHILIVDDHQMFRSGLSIALQALTELNTISESARIADAKLKIESCHQDIDLILLDQNLPDGTGSEFLQHLQQHYPLLPVAILSAEENIKLMKESLNGGAVGFIPKSTNTSVVLGAIQLMLSGGIYVPPKMIALSSLPAIEPQHHDINEQLALTQQLQTSLTPRQQEVMKLIMQGLANKDIAWQLNISEGTVKAHTTAILKAKGYYSRKQLIASGKHG